jgi:hypothetical protein
MMRLASSIIMASLIVTARAEAQRLDGTTAILAEAAGGTVGSLVGFGLVYAVAADKCGVDDLRCDIASAGAAVLTATLLSTAGVYLAGRLADTEPHVPGAALGALVGAAAGIGVWHLIADNINVNDSMPAGMIGFSVTQGTLAALGSALGRRR